jgi:hypothetical protein
MDTSEKIGLYGLGALLVGGLAYYYMKTKGTSPTNNLSTGLAILSYKNNRTGTSVAAPATLNDVQAGDVVTVNFRYSYAGKDAPGTILEVATVDTGGHFKNHQSKTISITGTPSEETYTDSIDLQVTYLTTTGWGLAFSMQFTKSFLQYLEIWNEGEHTVHATTMTHAIGPVTAATGTSNNKAPVSNIQLVPIAPNTLTHYYQPGDTFSFNLTFNHYDSSDGGTPYWGNNNTYFVAYIGTKDANGTFHPDTNQSPQTFTHIYGWPTVPTWVPDNEAGPFTVNIPANSTSDMFIGIKYMGGGNAAAAESGPFRWYSQAILVNAAPGQGGNAQLNLSVSPETTGIILPSQDPFSLKIGSTVTLQAIPNAGNTFKDWLLNGQKAPAQTKSTDVNAYYVQNGYSYLVVKMSTTNESVVAEFTGKTPPYISVMTHPYSLDNMELAGQIGLSSPDITTQGQHLKSGDQVIIQSLPNAGYSFVKFTVVGNDANGNSVSRDYTDETITITVYDGEYQIDCYLVGQVAIISVGVDPEEIPANNVNVSPAQSQYHRGDQVTFSVIAPSGYVLDHWMVNNVATPSASVVLLTGVTTPANTLTVTLTGDVTVVAVLDYTSSNVVTLTLACSPPAAGYSCFIELSPAGILHNIINYDFTKGTQVTLTAYPGNAAVWQFDHWWDGDNILTTAQKTQNPLVIPHLNKSASLQAVFTAVVGGGGGEGGGGGGGGMFPAPGTVGDGQYWMYITFLASYGGTSIWIGYNTYLDEYDPQDSDSEYNELASVLGPYASGATS